MIINDRADYDISHNICQDLATEKGNACTLWSETKRWT